MGAKKKKGKKKEKPKKTSKKPRTPAPRPTKPQGRPGRASARRAAVLDFGGSDGRVLVGAASFQGCRVLLRVNGDDLLRIDAPEAPSGPARLTASFHDATGKLICRIVENEPRNRAQGWRVGAEGP